MSKHDYAPNDLVDWLENATHNQARTDIDYDRDSSSRQASTTQHSQGLELGSGREREFVAESRWKSSQIQPSPFTSFAPQRADGSRKNARPSNPVEGRQSRHSSVHFAETPPDSCCEDNLPSGQLLTAPERTKSRLMADIADELSRNHHQTPRHARKSSADSHDSFKDPSRRTRKRGRWQLAKASSAPDGMAFNLPSIPVSTNSPCESGNWQSHTYQDIKGGVSQVPARGMEAGQVGPARLRTAARKRYAGRFRTSKFIGVGSSNRKTQWQARILVEGKVTHLGYYNTEEEAAKTYDKVALSLNPNATTNFPAAHYPEGGAKEFSGLGREDLQRALGVKPMDKSSRFRGVSRKKGKWEAKVMVNRKWVFRALFDNEDAAAHAYDAAVWRLKPKEATSFVNFKDGVSVRDSPVPNKSPKQELKRSPSTLPSEPVLVKIEEGLEDNQMAGRAQADLTLMDVPSSQDLFKHGSISSEDDLYSQPEVEPIRSRSQSARLPVNRSQSCQVSMNTLNQAPSLPAELGLTTQASILSSAPSPMELSPKRSLLDSASIDPILPPVVPVMKTVALPDPNSIGVPPPANLPFPRLVTGGLASTRPNTPHRPMDSFAHSPVRAVSAGLPPLPARPSSTLDPKAFLSGTVSPLRAQTPRGGSPMEDSHNLMNPFYSAASLPHSHTHPDLYGLGEQVMNNLDGQANMLQTMPAVPDIHRAASECLLGPAQITADLPFSSSLPEVLNPTQLPGSRAGLVNVPSSYYLPPSTRMAICEPQPLCDVYPGISMSQVDSALSYETACNLASSRSASSTYMHSSQTANSNLMRTASLNGGLPLYPGELTGLRTGSTGLPTLHHSVSMDSSFLAQAEMIQAQARQAQLQSQAQNLPTLTPGTIMPDTRALNAEQADLLNSLDVDVAKNEPLDLNPVQIGGEDMNVYSADIMGDLLQ